MQQSHLTGAPSNQALEASTTPIVPGQGAPFVLARRLLPDIDRRIEAKPTACMYDAFRPAFSAVY
jgi:hypothetical protein